jgi:F-type H+-transporting ATPase subunit gamma
MGSNLKEVRERIKSVVSTQQITNAMKMVAAAKLRRAQTAIIRLRPFAMKLNDILNHILKDLNDEAAIIYSTPREVEKALIIVVTSNRGLCGAFNSNIIKEAVRTAGEYQHLRKEGKLAFLCIGKRGYDGIRKRFPDCKIINDYVHLFDDLSFSNIIEVPNLLMQYFETSEYDIMHVCYSRFKNAGVQYAEQIQYLPVLAFDDGKPSLRMRRADFLFEPDQNRLLDQLVPNILQTIFHRLLLETHASEHGARMTAMEQATENANELLRDLRISYNKARQEAITKEISEIVGGASALEG